MSSDLGSPKGTPPLPTLPGQAPKRNGAFAKALGRGILRIGGWRVVGEFPDLPRLVIIAAPHSSAWDAIWGLAVKLALGIELVFMAKREAFIGPVGWVLHWLGGIPIDRKAPGGVAQQIAGRMKSSEQMWFALAPEGTRRHVTRWKTGFWHIARRADVPVLCAWFHYPDRTIGLGPLVELTDDVDADLARLRAIYAPHMGKHRGV